MTQNYTQAIEWFKKAAEQGQIHAKYCLGYLIVHDLGTSENHDEGMRLICEAAEQGDAQAQFSVASMFEKMGKKDEAVEWYRVAAEKGHEKAKERLSAILP